MPESRKRKNAGTHRPVESDTDIRPRWTDGIKPSPRWWAPTMVTFMLIGLLWLVTYHISGAVYPIPAIGDWNQAIALGSMMVGFLMTMRWR